MGTFGPCVKCPWGCTHISDCSIHNHFSISVQFSPPNGPSFFGHHDSPSSLAESRYPPYPYIPALNTYTTHTNLPNPAYLPDPYIPILLLQPLHPTLHACPILSYLLYEQAVRWCGCVLPGYCVVGYYVLRHLLARLLHLNLICLLRASWRRKGC